MNLNIIIVVKEDGQCQEVLHQLLSQFEQTQFPGIRFQKKEVLNEHLNTYSKKLVLPTQDGFSFVVLNDILYCEAKGNYTLFFLANNEQIRVSKTLKVYAELLEEFAFFRINRSFLINLNHIKKYGRQKCPTVTMQDGKIISVSIHQRKAFLEKLTCFTN